MYKDTRMYGVEKWYHTAPKDANMRIPDSILKTVCFLAVKVKAGENAGKFLHLGTGFFVGIKEGNLTFPYLFTARHVIDDAKKYNFEKIYLRMNTDNGGVDEVEVEFACLGVLHADLVRNDAIAAN